MNKSEKTAPPFIWALFTQLRRYRFPLVPTDYQALKQALCTGFGWSSHEELCDLCCTLWAKTKYEKEIIRSLFEQLTEQFDFEDWNLESWPSITLQKENQNRKSKNPTPYKKADPIRMSKAPSRLPDISHDGVNLKKYHHFVLLLQHPLTEREITQIWRRLRQPVRQGPPIELDIERTIARRCHTGIVSEIVLVPRRRNTAKLLLLIDRQGSMTPFHRFVENVSATIQSACKIENVEVYYFHNVPAEGADDAILNIFSNEMFPVLDKILHKIVPLSKGYIFNDPNLLSPKSVKEVLKNHADKAAVVLISDGGAARGKYNTKRLLNTIAFFKAVRTYTTRYVWLNPLPQTYWNYENNNTAAQIARHIPMCPLDQSGMYGAVNVLRSQLYVVEKPI